MFWSNDGIIDKIDGDILLMTFENLANEIEIFNKLFWEFMFKQPELSIYSRTLYLIEWTEKF